MTNSVVPILLRNIRQIAPYIKQVAISDLIPSRLTWPGAFLLCLLSSWHTIDRWFLHNALSLQYLNVTFLYISILDGCHRHSASFQWLLSSWHAIYMSLLPYTISVYNIWIFLSVIGPFYVDRVLMLLSSNFSYPPDMPFRCTLSYPNWVFVFMASVNYISRCHVTFMSCVTCHELYWGHWWETMPWMPFS